MKTKVNKQFLNSKLTSLPKDLISQINPINGYKNYALWAIVKAKEWKVRKFDNAVFEAHADEFLDFLDSLNINLESKQNAAAHFKSVHNAALKIYEVIVPNEKGKGGYKQNIMNLNMRRDIIGNILEKVPKTTKTEIGEIYKDWENNDFTLSTDKTWLLNNYLNNADERQFSKALQKMLEFMAENQDKNDAAKLYVAFKMYYTTYKMDKINTADFAELYNSGKNIFTEDDAEDYPKFIALMDCFGLLRSKSPILKLRNDLVKTYRLNEGKVHDKVMKKVIILGQDEAIKDYPVASNNLTGALMDMHKKSDKEMKESYMYLGPYKNDNRFKAMYVPTYAEALTCYYFLNQLSISPATFFEKNVKFSPKTVEEVEYDSFNNKWLKSSTDPNVKLRTFTLFDSDLVPIIHAGGGVPDLELKIKNKSGKEITAVIETTCYDTGKASQVNEESAVIHGMIQMLRSCNSKKDLHSPAVVLVTLFDKVSEKDTYYAKEYKNTYKRMEYFTQNLYSEETVDEPFFKPEHIEAMNKEMARLGITWQEVKKFWPVVDVCGFRDLACEGQNIVKTIKDGSFFKKGINIKNTKKRS